MQTLGKVFPDCTRCHGPGSDPLRVAWGCDKPAASPVFHIGCSACAGQDPDCEDCKGTGEIAMHRCPSALLDAEPDLSVGVGMLVRAYVQYDARHVLPCGKRGYMEHPATFTHGVEIIDSERARWERMRDDARERERKAAEMRSRQSNASKPATPARRKR